MIDIYPLALIGVYIYVGRYVSRMFRLLEIRFNKKDVVYNHFHSKYIHCIFFASFGPNMILFPILAFYRRSIIIVSFLEISSEVC